MGRKAIPMETIVCVEHILLDGTGAGSGEYLKLAQIKGLLSDLYGIEVSKDTVAAAVAALCGETLSRPGGIRAGILGSGFCFVCTDGVTPRPPKLYAVKRG